MNARTAWPDLSIAVFVVGVLPYVLYRVVRWARTRAKGAYALGAVLLPLGAFGNVSDPDNRIVQEAKELKKREEDNAGDPPNE